MNWLLPSPHILLGLKGQMRIVRRLNTPEEEQALLDARREYLRDAKRRSRLKKRA